MSLVGPTGVLVLVLMLSGTQGRIAADGKWFSEFEMRLEGSSPLWYNVDSQLFFFFFFLVIHKTKQANKTCIKDFIRIVKIRPALLVPAWTDEHTSKQMQCAGWGDVSASKFQRNLYTSDQYVRVATFVSTFWFVIWRVKNWKVFVSRIKGSRHVWQIRS